MGVDRDDLSSQVLKTRTDLMIQAQTFVIMREPQALIGAKRIFDPQLQSIFRYAADSSGVPQDLIESIAYLESFADPAADNGLGPKGIMQIAEATAHDMGLKVSRVTRYKITREKVALRTKGTKPKYKTVTHKTPYVVMVRDDRMVPAAPFPPRRNTWAGWNANSAAKIGRFSRIIAAPAA